MKQKYFLIPVIILTIIILVVGKIHYDNKIKVQAKSSKIQYEQYQKEDKNQREAFIKSLKPVNNKKESILKYLKYKELTEGTVKISVIGSSVTYGTGASNQDSNWLGILSNHLRVSSGDLSLEKLKTVNHGKGGYSVQNLLNKNVFQDVINDKPDLVIFETSVLNSHGQSVSIEDTLNCINKGYEQMRKGLPDAKFLVVSPNPSSEKLKTGAVINSIGLKYSDYLNATKAQAEENKWNYFDSYSAINKYLQAHKIKLDSILIDGVHPNDQGYQIWGDALYNFFKNLDV